MKKLIVFFAAIVLVAAFTVPAMAETTWNFYGNARVATWYVRAECEDVPCADRPQLGSDFPLRTGDEARGGDEELYWDEQSNARIGARIRNGAVDGQFEFGAGTTDGGESVRTRHLWGRWDFGPAKLLVGKTYAPSNVFYSGQAFGTDLGFIDGGTLFTGRDGQIQIQYGGFTFALINVDGADDLGVGDDLNATFEGRPGFDAADTRTDVDVLLPRFEVGYNYSQDMFFLDVIGGFQTYKIAMRNDTISYSEKIDVNSYFGFIGGGLNFGPGYFKGSFAYEVNPGPYGMLNIVDGDPKLRQKDRPNDIDDMNVYTLQLIGGYKLNDMVTFEGGYAYANSELDASSTKADDFSTYYFQAVLQPAPGVFFIPEVGVRDFMKSGCAGANCVDRVDEGKHTYVGAKWQINF
jgi:hypothetical protein